MPGGKRGIPNYVRGYKKIENQNQEPNGCIVFRDRDFDYSPPLDGIRLIENGKPYIVCTFRASIENYFLDPVLMAHYFEWLGRTPNYQNKQLTRISTDFLNEKIKESASRIKAHTALRWALANQKQELGRIEFRNNTERQDGNLPIDLTEMACRTSGIQYIQQFKKDANRADAVRFENDFERYLTQFNERDFLQNGGHHIWFHGKDLKKSFSQVIVNERDFRGWNFSFDAYINRFCDLNNSSTLIFDVNAHQDFVELNNRLQNLT